MGVKFLGAPVLSQNGHKTGFHHTHPPPNSINALHPHCVLLPTLMLYATTLPQQALITFEAKLLSKVICNNRLQGKQVKEDSNAIAIELPPGLMKPGCQQLGSMTPNLTTVIVGHLELLEELLSLSLESSRLRWWHFGHGPNFELLVSCLYVTA